MSNIGPKYKIRTSAGPLNHWCRRFGQTLKAATTSIPLYSILLHKFYVDDQGLAVPCPFQDEGIYSL